MDREQLHHYEVVETETGFNVVPKETEKEIITCNLDSNGFWNLKAKWSEHELPAFAFRNLLSFIVLHLYSTWNTSTNPSRTPRQGWKVRDKILNWAKTNTAKTLNHPVHAIWKKKINELNLTVYQLHKRMFSISGGNGYWDNIRHLLSSGRIDEYLWNDIMNYRAAAIAVLWGDIKDWEKDWRFVFCETGTYTSLNRTLINLPGGVTPAMLAHLLRHVILPEPAVTRIRLTAYIEGINSALRGRHDFESLIHRSSDEEIKEAVKLMWHWFPSKYTKDFRVTKEISRALGLIYDYVGEWDNLSMLGLARRSVEYHRDEELQRRLQQEEIERRQRLHKEEMEKIKLSDTAKPKIKLLDNDKIRFLSTYQSVIDEGNLMHHCIASYAESAVKGNCFLFHVEHNNEMASIEVDPKGFVRQSYGPHDTTNSASEYGRRILSEWAKKLQGERK